MAISTRQLVAAAQEIRDQCFSCQTRNYQEIPRALSRYLALFERLEGFKRKLSICSKRDWRGAAAKILKNMKTLLDEFRFLLSESEQAIKQCASPVPSLKDIYDELLQTKEELGLQYSSQDKVLSVTTEPIELEAVYLGEFEIHLNIPHLGKSHNNEAYTIEAIDPHPAAGNDLVTHPHVNEERLCPGTGEASIYTALSSGRICDFFTLVRTILNTYNESSPYIPLSDWNRQPCGECSARISNNEAYYCCSCEERLCVDCASSCNLCEETSCVGCLQTCPRCEEVACRECIKNCPDCGDALCSECLKEGECSCSQTEEVEKNEQEQKEKADSRKDPEITPAFAEGVINSIPPRPASTAAG